MRIDMAMASDGAAAAVGEGENIPTRSDSNAGDYTSMERGAWSVLKKESGEILVIDHTKLTVVNVVEGR